MGDVESQFYWPGTDRFGGESVHGGLDIVPDLEWGGRYVAKLSNPYGTA